MPRCHAGCESEGALYAFPRLTIPEAAQAAAREAAVAPDLFYCLSLLNATGIVAVPGSGFKQVRPPPAGPRMHHPHIRCMLVSVATGN